MSLDRWRYESPAYQPRLVAATIVAVLLAITTAIGVVWWLTS